MASISRFYGIPAISGKPLIPDLKNLFFEDYTHFNECMPCGNTEKAENYGKSVFVKYTFPMIPAGRDGINIDKNGVMEYNAADTVI